ncbi:PxKF domain-containing protein [Arthrobacter sp.]|uniref:PxKF domain-containing protein n=1 Tax=Arthrobacter sp. TaxID=1667 RepID=UPI00281239F6|nr:PxKF domain-containing protein [Arthrobacter sp.]
MFAVSTTRRATAVFAALLLLLAVPLGAPATADSGHINVSAVLDSPGLLANVNGGSPPPADLEVTFEVFNVSGGALVPKVSAVTSSWDVASASFDLEDGRYKIKVSAPGFVESWFTASSGAEEGDAVFTQLLGYQERRTLETADTIVVDTLNPTNSSWVTGAFTVLHRTASSITGAVGKDAAISTGSMLPGVAVELYPASDPAGAPVAGTVTDENGYYTFEDVLTGSYLVRFISGTVDRWWPETPHRAEAEAITLSGANHFNLAYAVFPAALAAVDPAHSLTLTGEPALGATLTATSTVPVELSPAGGDCFQRYSWYVGETRVDGAFGPTFVVPLDAGGETVHARLNTAGIACTYWEVNSEAITVDPSLTLLGESVVIPVDNTGGKDVTLTFENVTTSGTTTVTRLESDSDYPPEGFSSLTDPPLYYDIHTTAEFDPASGVEICISFVPTDTMTEDQAAGQHLYHYVDGAWKDITSSSSYGKVCGITDSFSPFAVGQPNWPFVGFQQPVDNDGVLNAMKAGAAVPIKFGVGGNRGPEILAGAPTSTVIACPGGVTPDTVEQTVAAETSSLSYSADSDTYTFVWKTQKTWAGSCRQFELRLDDGSLHTALFDFRK